MIFGMYTIKPVKLGLDLDLENDVVTPGVLECAPFPVISKSAIRYVPNFIDSCDKDLTMLTDVEKYAHITEECVNECILIIFLSHATKPLKYIAVDMNNSSNIADQQLALFIKLSDHQLGLVKKGNSE